MFIVGATYYARLKIQAGSAPAKPQPLAPGVVATGHSWSYTHTTADKTVITVHAEDLQEIDGKQHLTGVELDIYNKDGSKYNHVKSAKAEFDMNAGILFSDGDVEITMSVPANDTQPKGRLTVIKTSGVRVESKTGHAVTDRPAVFQFDRGDGKCVGADYNPETRELIMRSQVELLWRGKDPKAPPMKIESTDLTYKERESKVYLGQTSKLTRDTLTLNGSNASIDIDPTNGLIKLVQAKQANGQDKRTDRTLDYSADNLTLDFNDDNQIQKITGTDHARVVSTADTSVTTMTSDTLVMDFDTSTKDSILQNAVGNGHGVVESKPVIKPGVDPSDTRILKADTVTTKMRPGGRDIAALETSSPSSVEFIPNRPTQPHRWLNGERMVITYGEKNQIQSLKTSAVTTRTEKPRTPKDKEAPAPEITSSKDLVATFQPNSSQISKLEQTGDFRFESGERHGQADRALLDQIANRIDLVGKARVSDSTGSADADKIQLDQKSGDFTAEGNVSSTRLPDKKDPPKDAKDKGPKESANGSMLGEDEPLHARARKMSSTDNKLQIRYEGNVVLWQGANRLQGDIVEIDRDNGILKAHGHVVSQLQDKAKDATGDTADPKKPAPAPPAAKSATSQPARVFTTVRAPELIYDDEKRIADYKGGAVLERSNMTVKAAEIHAFLRNDSDDSSLDHAFGDGKVEIRQTLPARIRTGTSEHAEYYVDDDRVLLTGGRPLFIDNIRGRTEGEKLTWFSKDDRLLVDGVEKQPAKSVLIRKKKKP
jgi:lipopolysaccharide export system protein LptA